MKLATGLVAALAGCASAAQQSAEVYMLSSRDTSSKSPQSLTPSLARLLLLQRLAPTDKKLSVHDIPNGVEIESVVSLINNYGRETRPLFAGAADEPSQLVVMVESLSDKEMKQMRKAINKRSSLTIEDPPADKEHQALLELDFYRAGVADGNKCSLAQVADPKDNCWGGKQSAVAKYNTKDVWLSDIVARILRKRWLTALQTPNLISELSKKMKQLMKLANSGNLETTIVLLPSSNSANKWIDEQQELRRRQAEMVLSSADKTAESPESTATAPIGAPFFAPKGPIPACFDSEEACLQGTANCTGHGECQSKYSKGDQACFACHCLSTWTNPEAKSGSVTHWAGPTCAKQDISTPFWLFAGFTLVLLGILWMSISLLFSVGQERLPGVIGAGVSKTK